MKARLILFWLRVEDLGWEAVRKPVERCEDCGKVWRVLWWYRGDHTHLPF